MHTYTYTQIHTHRYMHINTCTHTHAHRYIRTDTYTWIHAHVYIRINTCTNMYTSPNTGVDPNILPGSSHVVSLPSPPYTTPSLGLAQGLGHIGLELCTSCAT